MEFKGTKGPWYVVNGDVQYMGKSLFIADKPTHITYSPVVCALTPLDSLTKEDIANAKLISKAPEMLEMLEYLVENDYIANLDNVKKAKQLIKEATEL